MRMLWGLAALALLAACGGSKPKPTPAREEIGKVSPDRGIARMLASGDVDLARKAADSLLSSKDPGDREIGTYWRAVCMLYRNQPDSALAIFQTHAGKWSGGLRNVHSEAFLRLMRELTQAQAAAKARKEEAATEAKTFQDKIEGLEKETGDLRAEIARLETEKQKYEKLLKDLETIH